MNAGNFDGFDRRLAGALRGATATLAWGLCFACLGVEHVVDAASAVQSLVNMIAACAVLTAAATLLPRAVGGVVAVVGSVALVVVAAMPPLFALFVGAGVVLAVLMQHGAPAGRWRDLRIVLQSSSLLAGMLAIVLVASGPPPLLPAWCSMTITDHSDLAAHLMGVVMVVGGGAWVAVCVRHLVAGGGTADPLDPPLVRCVSGPYAHSAHPMQRGQAAVVVGLALVVGTVGAVVAALCTIAVLVGPVRALEARQLKTRFSPAA